MDAFIRTACPMIGRLMGGASAKKDNDDYGANDDSTWRAVGRLMESRTMEMSDMVSFVMQAFEPSHDSFVDPISILRDLAKWLGRIQVRDLPKPDLHNLSVTPETANTVAARIMEYIVKLVSRARNTKDASQIEKFIKSLEEEFHDKPGFERAFEGATPETKLRSLLVFVALQTRVVMSALLPKVGVLYAVDALNENIFDRYVQLLEERLKKVVGTQDIMDGLKRIQGLFSHLRKIAHSVLHDDIALLKSGVNMPEITEYLNRMEGASTLTPNESQILYAVILLTSASEMVTRLGRANKQIATLVNRENLDLSRDGDLRKALQFIIENRDDPDMMKALRPGDEERLKMFVNALAILGHDLTITYGGRAIKGGTFVREEAVPVLYLTKEQTAKLQTLISNTGSVQKDKIVAKLNRTTKLFLDATSTFLRTMTYAIDVPLSAKDVSRMSVAMSRISKNMMLLPRNTAAYGVLIFALITKTSPFALVPRLKTTIQLLSQIQSYFDEIADVLKALKNHGASIETAVIQAKKAGRYADALKDVLEGYVAELKKQRPETRTSLARVTEGGIVGADGQRYVKIEPTVVSGSNIVTVGGARYVPQADIDPSSAVILPTTMSHCDGSQRCILGGGRASAIKGAKAVLRGDWGANNLYVAHNLGHDYHLMKGGHIEALKAASTAEPRIDGGDPLASFADVGANGDYSAAFDMNSIEWEPMPQDDEIGGGGRKRKAKNKDTYTEPVSTEWASKAHAMRTCRCEGRGPCTCRRHTQARGPIHIASPYGGHTIYPTASAMSADIVGGDIQVLRDQQEISQQYEIVAQMIKARAQAYDENIMPLRQEQTTSAINEYRRALNHIQGALQRPPPALDMMAHVREAHTHYPALENTVFEKKNLASAEQFAAARSQSMAVLPAILDFITTMHAELARRFSEAPMKQVAYSTFTTGEKEAESYFKAFDILNGSVSRAAHMLAPYHDISDTNTLEEWIHRSSLDRPLFISDDTDPERGYAVNTPFPLDPYLPLTPPSVEDMSNAFMHALLPMLMNLITYLQNVFDNDVPPKLVALYKMIMKEMPRLMASTTIEFTTLPPLVMTTKINIPHDVPRPTLNQISLFAGDIEPLTNNNLASHLTDALVNTRYPNQYRVQLRDNNGPVALVLPSIVAPTTTYMTGRTNLLPHMLILTGRDGPDEVRAADDLRIASRMLSTTLTQRDLRQLAIDMTNTDYVLPQDSVLDNNPDGVLYRVVSHIISNTAIEPNERRGTAVALTHEENIWDQLAPPPHYQMIPDPGFVWPVTMNEVERAPGAPPNGHKYPAMVLLNHAAPQMRTIHAELLHKLDESIIAMFTGNKINLIMNRLGLFKSLKSKSAMNQMFSAIAMSGGGNKPDAVSGPPILPALGNAAVQALAPLGGTTIGKARTRKRKTKKDEANDEDEGIGIDMGPASRSRTSQQRAARDQEPYTLMSRAQLDQLTIDDIADADMPRNIKRDIFMSVFRSGQYGADDISGSYSSWPKILQHITTFRGMAFVRRMFGHRGQVIGGGASPVGSALSVDALRVDANRLGPSPADLEAAIAPLMKFQERDLRALFWGVFSIQYMNDIMRQIIGERDKNKYMLMLVNRAKGTPRGKIIDLLQRHLIEYQTQDLASNLYSTMTASGDLTQFMKELIINLLPIIKEYDGDDIMFFESLIIPIQTSIFYVDAAKREEFVKRVLNKQTIDAPTDDAMMEIEFNDPYDQIKSIMPDDLSIAATANQYSTRFGMTDEARKKAMENMANMAAMANMDAASDKIPPLNPSFEYTSGAKLGSEDLIERMILVMRQMINRNMFKDTWNFDKFIPLTYKHFSKQTNAAMRFAYIVEVLNKLVGGSTTAPKGGPEIIVDSPLSIIPLMLGPIIEQVNIFQELLAVAFTVDETYHAKMLLELNQKQFSLERPPVIPYDEIVRDYENFSQNPATSRYISPEMVTTIDRWRGNHMMGGELGLAQEVIYFWALRALYKKLTDGSTDTISEIPIAFNVMNFNAVDPRTKTNDREYREIVYGLVPLQTPLQIMNASKEYTIKREAINSISKFDFLTEPNPNNLYKHSDIQNAHNAMGIIFNKYFKSDDDAINAMVRSFVISMLYYRLRHKNTAPANNTYEIDMSMPLGSITSTGELEPTNEQRQLAIQTRQTRAFEERYQFTRGVITRAVLDAIKSTPYRTLSLPHLIDFFGEMFATRPLDDEFVLTNILPAPLNNYATPPKSLAEVFEPLLLHLRQRVDVKNATHVKNFKIMVSSMFPPARLWVAATRTISAVANVTAANITPIELTHTTTGQMTVNWLPFCEQLKESISMLHLVIDQLGAKLPTNIRASIRDIKINDVSINTILYTLAQPVTNTSMQSGVEYIQAGLTRSLNIFDYVAERTKIWLRDSITMQRLNIARPIIQRILPCRDPFMLWNEFSGLSKDVNDPFLSEIPFKRAINVQMPHVVLPMNSLSTVGFVGNVSNNRLGYIHSAMTDNFLIKFNQYLNCHAESALYRHHTQFKCDWSLLDILKKVTTIMCGSLYPSYLSSLLTEDQFRVAVPAQFPDTVYRTSSLRPLPMTSINVRDYTGAYIIDSKPSDEYDDNNTRELATIMLGVPEGSPILLASVYAFLQSAINQMTPMVSTMPGAPGAETISVMLDFETMNEFERDRAISSRVFLAEAIQTFVDSLLIYNNTMRHIIDLDIDNPQLFILDDSLPTNFRGPDGYKVYVVTRFTPPHIFDTQPVSTLSTDPATLRGTLDMAAELLKACGMIQKDLRDLVKAIPTTDCFNIPPDVTPDFHQLTPALKRPSTKIPAILTSTLAFRPLEITRTSPDHMNLGRTPYIVVPSESVRDQVATFGSNQAIQIQNQISVANVYTTFVREFTSSLSSRLDAFDRQLTTLNQTIRTGNMVQIPPSDQDVNVPDGATIDSLLNLFDVPINMRQAMANLDIQTIQVPDYVGPEELYSYYLTHIVNIFSAQPVPNENRLHMLFNFFMLWGHSHFPLFIDGGRPHVPPIPLNQERPEPLAPWYRIWSRMSKTDLALMFIIWSDPVRFFPMILQYFRGNTFMIEDDMETIEQAVNQIITVAAIAPIVHNHLNTMAAHGFPRAIDDLVFDPVGLVPNPADNDYEGRVCGLLQENLRAMMIFIINTQKRRLFYQSNINLNEVARAAIQQVRNRHFITEIRQLWTSIPQIVSTEVPTLFKMHSDEFHKKIAKLKQTILGLDLDPNDPRTDPDYQLREADPARARGFRHLNMEFIAHRIRELERIVIMADEFLRTAIIPALGPQGELNVFQRPRGQNLPPTAFDDIPTMDLFDRTIRGLTKWPVDARGFNETMYVVIPMTWGKRAAMYVVTVGQYRQLKTYVNSMIQEIDAMAQSVHTNSTMGSAQMMAVLDDPNNYAGASNKSVRVPTISISRITTPTQVSTGNIGNAEYLWPAHVNPQLNRVSARIVGACLLMRNNPELLALWRGVFNKIFTGSKHQQDLLPVSGSDVNMVSALNMAIHRRVAAFWHGKCVRGLGGKEEGTPGQSQLGPFDIALNPLPLCTPALNLTASLTAKDVLQHITMARRYPFFDIRRLIRRTQPIEAQNAAENGEPVDDGTEPTLTPIMEIMGAIMVSKSYYQLLYLSGLVNNLSCSAPVRVRAILNRQYLRDRLNMTPRGGTVTAASVMYRLTSSMEELTYREFLEAVQIYHGNTMFGRGPFSPLQRVFGGLYKLIFWRPKANPNPYTELTSAHELVLIPEGNITMEWVANYDPYILNQENNRTYVYCDLRMVVPDSIPNERQLGNDADIQENKFRREASILMNQLANVVHLQRMAYLFHECVAVRQIIQIIILETLDMSIINSNAILGHVDESDMNKEALFRARAVMDIP